MTHSGCYALGRSDTSSTDTGRVCHTRDAMLLVDPKHRVYLLCNNSAQFIHPLPPHCTSRYLGECHGCRAVESKDGVQRWKFEQDSEERQRRLLLLRLEAQPDSGVLGTSKAWKRHQRRKGCKSRLSLAEGRKVWPTGDGVGKKSWVRLIVPPRKPIFPYIRSKSM